MFICVTVCYHFSRAKMQGRPGTEIKANDSNYVVDRKSSRRVVPGGSSWPLSLSVCLKDYPFLVGEADVLLKQTE